MLPQREPQRCALCLADTHSNFACCLFLNVAIQTVDARGVENNDGRRLGFSELAIYSASGDGGRALTTYPALPACHDVGGGSCCLSHSRQLLCEPSGDFGVMHHTGGRCTGLQLSSC